MTIEKSITTLSFCFGISEKTGLERLNPNQFTIQAQHRKKYRKKNTAYRRITKTKQLSSVRSNAFSILYPALFINHHYFLMINKATQILSSWLIVVPFLCRFSLLPLPSFHNLLMITDHTLLKTVYCKPWWDSHTLTRARYDLQTLKPSLWWLKCTCFQKIMLFLIALTRSSSCSWKTPSSTKILTTSKCRISVKIIWNPPH